MIRCKMGKSSGTLAMQIHVVPIAVTAGVGSTWVGL